MRRTLALLLVALACAASVRVDSRRAHDEDHQAHAQAHNEKRGFLPAGLGGAVGGIMGGAKPGGGMLSAAMGAAKVGVGVAAAALSSSVSGPPDYEANIEDCVACKLIWSQVEMDVGESKADVPIYNSFRRNCVEAQETPVFYPACQDMFASVDNMIADYVADFNVNQICENNGICRPNSLLNTLLGAAMTGAVTTGAV